VIAGGVLAAVAAAHGGSHPIGACWGDCPAPPKPAFATLCELGSSTPCGGVLAAPLGFALVVSGASFGAGALIGDEGELPLIPLIAGVVLGAGAYGLLAALNGGGR
jgi:hypothetical protein